MKRIRSCESCKFSNKPEDKNNGGCFACKDTRGKKTIYLGWIARK